MGLLTGSDAKLKKFDTLTHDQKKILAKIGDKIDYKSFDMSKNKLYQEGQNFLRGLMQPGAMDKLYSQLEAPMQRQFQEEIIPGIAERFSGMGAGAQSSSAFNQSMGQAGAGLAERLAALRGQLTQQGVNQQLEAAQMGLNYAQLPASINMGLSQLALGTQAFGYQNIPGQPGIGQGILGALGTGAASAFGSAAGGPLGALAASGIKGLFA